MTRLITWLTAITELDDLIGEWHQLAAKPHTNRAALEDVERHMGARIVKIVGKR